MSTTKLRKNIFHILCAFSTISPQSLRSLGQTGLHIPFVFCQQDNICSFRISWSCRIFLYIVIIFVPTIESPLDLVTRLIVTPILRVTTFWSLIIVLYILSWSLVRFARLIPPPPPPLFLDLEDAAAFGFSL